MATFDECTDSFKNGASDPHSAFSMAFCMCTREREYCRHKEKANVRARARGTTRKKK